MGRKKIDYTNECFNKMTVLYEVEKNSYGRRFMCRCDCGEEKIINHRHLYDTKSCGCEKNEMPWRANLLNEEFGLLTVLEELAKDKNGHRMWRCLCECGKEKNVNTSDLTNGGVKSCGCLNHLYGEDNPLFKEKPDLVCFHCGIKFKKEGYRPGKHDGSNVFHSRECWASWVVGENNPSWKPKVIRECEMCGKLLEIQPWRAKNYERSFCKSKEGEKMSGCQVAWFIENYQGKDNPAWRGGAKQDPYCNIWKDPDFKSDILERDGNKCLGPDCRKNCDHLPLFRHHIDGVKENCHPWNLITVCVSCNTRAEGSKEKSRDEWQAEYQQIMSNLYGFEYEQQLSLLEAVNQ